MTNQDKSGARTPKQVLDLFCKAGGAAMGLQQAWPDAEIVGVDIEPQPRYPFEGSNIRRACCRISRSSALARLTARKSSVGRDNYEGVLPHIKSFLLKPKSLLIQGVLLAIIGLLLFSRGFNRSVAWMFFVGFGAIACSTALLANELYVLTH